MIMHYKTAAAFRAVVAELERERGHTIGGFAKDEKTGQWKVIRPDGKFELLKNRLNSEKRRKK